MIRFWVMHFRQESPRNSAVPSRYMPSTGVWWSPALSLVTFSLVPVEVEPAQVHYYEVTVCPFVTNMYLVGEHLILCKYPLSSHSFPFITLASTDNSFLKQLVLFAKWPFFVSSSCLYLLEFTVGKGFPFFLPLFIYSNVDSGFCFISWVTAHFYDYLHVVHLLIFKTITLFSNILSGWQRFKNTYTINTRKHTLCVSVHCSYYLIDVQSVSSVTSGGLQTGVWVVWPEPRVSGVAGCVPAALRTSCSRPGLHRPPKEPCWLPWEIAFRNHHHDISGSRFWVGHHC